MISLDAAKPRFGVQLDGGNGFIQLDAAPEHVGIHDGLLLARVTKEGKDGPRGHNCPEESSLPPVVGVPLCKLPSTVPVNRPRHTPALARERGASPQLN